MLAVSVCSGGGREEKEKKKELRWGGGSLIFIWLFKIHIRV